MKYGGLAMLGIVRDSRSFHTRMALHIPVFFILFQAGRTRRLSRGHLQCICIDHTAESWDLFVTKKKEKKKRRASYIKLYNLFLGS